VDRDTYRQIPLYAESKVRQAESTTPDSLKKFLSGLTPQRNAAGDNLNITPKQRYDANAASRYAKSLGNAGSNAFMPELDSPLGEAASVTLATVPFWDPGNRFAAAASGGYLGLNALRALNTYNVLGTRLNEIQNDTIAPGTPTADQFMLNGVAANADANFIADTPINEWAAYLKQQDKNNGVMFRIPTERSHSERIKQLIRAGILDPNQAKVSPNFVPPDVEAMGKPVYTVPDTWYNRLMGTTGKLTDEPPYSRGPYTDAERKAMKNITEFTSNFGQELKPKYTETLDALKNFGQSSLKAVSNIPNKVLPKMNYDELKNRTMYPSGAAK
jgi:hypothetical protein